MAGYYTDRTKAAYWDGKNAFGEKVASGPVFLSPIYRKIVQPHARC